MNNALSRIRRPLLAVAIWFSFFPLLQAQEAAGSLDPTFNAGAGVTGAAVNSIAVQPDGKIVIAGDFTAVDGQARNSIARLLPSGEVESTTTFNVGSGADFPIRSLALQPDGKIVIVGQFTLVNGQARTRIARLFPDGTIESTVTFNPGIGANGNVHCVVVQGDGKILLGGEFTTINGQPRSRIARLSPDGTLESTATFNLGDVGGVIQAMALQPDGKIVIGGTFSTINGQPRNCVARLHPHGTLENTSTFNPGTGANQPVRSVAVQANGKIVLGGNFTMVNGQARNRIARLNGNGSVENTSTFNAGLGVNGVVHCLGVQRDGKILVGGAYSAVNGQARSSIARLLSDGTLESTNAFQGTIGDGSPVLCSAIQNDGKLLLGGQFAAVNGQPRARVARLSNVIAHTGPVHELVHSFVLPPKNPSAGPLAAGPDGYYWGTTRNGGQMDDGTIYKVKGDGSDSQTIVSFTGNGPTNRGSSPSGGLRDDGAGNFWGATAGGGALNAGTIFKVNAITGAVTTVVEFDPVGATNRGMTPNGELLRDEAGNFWGTTLSGGTFSFGTVYKVNISTGVLTTVVDFTYNGATNRGGHPRSGLSTDGAGFFWGTTSIGGLNGPGTIFKFDPTTGTLTTVFDFPAGASQTGTELAADGAGFLWGVSGDLLFKFNITTEALTNVANLGGFGGARLVRDGDHLWGTVLSGGTDFSGSIYKVEIDSGEVTLARSFLAAEGVQHGLYPEAGLISDGAGSFLGTTTSGGRAGQGTAFKLNAATGELTTLTAFTDEFAAKKGNFPYAGLISDGAGFLWGTTQHGGMGNGTIFKLEEATGELTTVIEFTDKGAQNRGAEPRAMLTNDGAGFLWGSTSEGGAENGGTVFKLNIGTGELTTVHEFAPGQPANNGSRPNAELVNDGEGFLWGSTFQGGLTRRGSIFKVNLSTGELTTVYDSFSSQNGYGPYAALTSDGAGSFWGTTNRGGSSGDHGTIFKIHQETGEFTSVARFTGLGFPNLGTEPRSKLLQDATGDFWGITSEGGIPGGDRGLGTVYRVNARTGAVTTVVQFTGFAGARKGSEPRAQLIPDEAGTLWGTTWKGGAQNEGTVFKLNGATGEFTTVLEFSGFGSQANSGSLPGYGSLLRHTDGNFYGTTQEAGPEGGGTIFRLRFGPTPLTLESTGAGETTATLLGTINPNGNATAVSFEISTSPTLSGAVTWEAGVSEAGTEAVRFTQLVTGLQPSTTYYYRIIGTNAENPIPQRGTIRTFRTPPNLAPVVTLLGNNPLTLEAGPGGYEDAGATASDAEDGVIVPQMTANTVVRTAPGTYSVTWSATDSVDQTTTATRTVNVIDSTSPSVTAPADVEENTLNASGAVVVYPPATASDAVGVTAIQYSHPSGSLFPRGTTTVTVTALDAAGNQGTATFTVTVTLSNRAHEALWIRGGAVPGAGVDARIPAGATWTSVGVPAISSTGKIAFLGKWRTSQSAGSGNGLFLDGQLVAKVGEASPVGGTKFAAFKAPIFAQDSDALLVPATLNGAAVTTENDSVLLSFSPGAAAVAREGELTGLGAGLRFGRFLGATAAGGTVLILAEVRGGVPAAVVENQVALFSAGPGGMSSLARTGQTMFGKRVVSLNLLRTVTGSAGHGRGELSDAGARFIARFTDGSQAIVQTAGPGAHTALAMSGQPINPDPLVERWKGFGPAVNSTADGSHFSFLAGLMPPIGTIPAAPAKGIFLGTAAGFEAIARLADPAPAGAEGTFSALGAPALAADGSSVVFTAKTKLGLKNTDGIFSAVPNGPLSTVTTLATPPADLPAGTRWKAFTSLAAPGGGLGPIFTATLQPRGPVNATNDAGLWAVDTNGILRCLVRKGDVIGEKTVSAIHVLRAVPGTPGVARAFNAGTQIAWQATFSDRSTGIILTTVP